MAIEYYIKREKADRAVLIADIDGELINLKGEAVKQEIPATKKRPARTVEIRAAKQADLRKIMTNKDKYGDYSRTIGSREKESKANKSS